MDDEVSEQREEQRGNSGGGRPGGVTGKGFLPGVSGNPRGRPRGRTVGALLLELRDRCELAGMPLPAGRTAGEMLAEVMWTRAIKGDIRFAQEILNRNEGKVPDRIAGPQGEPLFSPAQQRKVLDNPRALELLCEFDECLINGGDAGDQPGRVRPPGVEGAMGVPAAPVGPEP